MKHGDFKPGEHFCGAFHVATTEKKCWAENMMGCPYCKKCGLFKNTYDLETIYKILGSNRPFTKKGKLTQTGNVAHEKLIKLLAMLSDIGIVHNKIDYMEAEINKIIYIEN